MDATGAAGSIVAESAVLDDDGARRTVNADEVAARLRSAGAREVSVYVRP